MTYHYPLQDTFPKAKLTNASHTKHKNPSTWNEMGAGWMISKHRLQTCLLQLYLGPFSWLSRCLPLYGGRQWDKMDQMRRWAAHSTDVLNGLQQRLSNPFQIYSVRPRSALSVCVCSCVFVCLCVFLNLFVQTEWLDRSRSQVCSKSSKGGHTMQASKWRSLSSCEQQD